MGSHAIIENPPLSNIIDILYVEDDEEDARIMVRNFDNEKSAAYLLTHSATFSDALHQLKKRKFGAILLDLNLPDGKGLNGIDDIKEIYPDMPVVIITGYDDENTAIQALQRGAQEYIVKTHINSDIIKRILQSSILRKKVEQNLKQKAYTDSLTGLPNRLAFEQTASKMIERAKRWNDKEALLFIDLNKFKQVNDTYGHEAGNAVLIETAKRLQNTLRKSDMIARYAGDEFICYLDSNRSLKIDKKICQSVAQKIISAVEKPILFEGIELFISLSIGIAIFPDAGKDFNDLLKKADAAMYNAKENPNQKFCFVDEDCLEDVSGTKNSKTVSFMDDWKTILDQPTLLPSNENLNIQLPDHIQSTFNTNENLKKQYEEKFSSFAFMAAHDLRAPVRKIITFSEMLETQDNELDDNEKKYLIDRLSISGKRINDLIDNLLVFAKVVKSHEKIEKCCLTTLVEEILDDLKFWMKENNVSIQVEKLPELLIYKNQIRCIFYHLITNAVTYKKLDSECRIKIFPRIDNKSCTICISDNGIGIDRAYHAQIFSPFKRLHSSDQIEGTGLGLSICERAIEKHAGRIWVESELNKGSVFKFSFPLEKEKISSF